MKPIPHRRNYSYSQKETYTLYEVQCKTPNCYYIGITRNYARRKQEHQSGRGAPFTVTNGVYCINKIKDNIPTKEKAEAEEIEYIDYLSDYGLKVGGRPSTDKNITVYENSFSNRNTKIELA